MEKVARCNYSREEEEGTWFQKSDTALSFHLQLLHLWNNIRVTIKIFSKTNYHDEYTKTIFQKHRDVAQNFLKFLENLLKKKLLLNFKTTQFGINEERKEKITRLKDFTMAISKKRIKIFKVVHDQNRNTISSQKEENKGHKLTWN